MRSYLSHIPSPGRVVTFALLLIVPFLFILEIQAPLQVGPRSVHPSRRPSAPTLADLDIVQSPLMLAGGISTSMVDGKASKATFLLTTAPEKEINLVDAFMQIGYRDQHQRRDDLLWTWHFSGKHDGDARLNSGERVQINVLLDEQLALPLGPNEEFAFDLKPSGKAILTISDVTPALD